MGRRGFKSNAEKSLVVIEGGFGVERAQAPSELTPEQAQIWRDIVGSEPVEFFATAAQRALLKDYCFYRGEINRMNETINAFNPEWLKGKEGLKRYRELTKALDLHVARATSLATKMRLTSQSRYTPLSANTAVKHETKYPWEA
jgi:hypothetical protein